MVGVERRQVSKLEGQDIYEVSKFEVIPFMASTNHLSEAQVCELRLELFLVFAPAMVSGRCLISGEWALPFLVACGYCLISLLSHGPSFL